MFGSTAEMYRARDIVVGMGCAIHDVATGFRWAVSRYLDTDEMKSLFLLVEGLRNGSRYLYQVLPLFIATSVQFDDGGDGSVEDAEAFWSTVGVVGPALQEFGLLRPRWDGQILWINGAEQKNGDIFARISVIISYPWCWRKYNSARFLILGNGSRMLVCARLLGLDRIVAMGRAAPNASDYWLHHYGNIDARMCRFITVCGLGACVADALQVQLMDEPRLARYQALFHDALSEQLDYLSSLPSSLWWRLAAVVDAGEAWSELRSDAIHVATVTAAWFHNNVLELARSVPWCLCVGDVVSNVKALCAMDPELLDLATKSLRFLYVSGMATFCEMESALHLLGEAPWTIMDSEQGHGSLAVQHRVHRFVSAEVLAIRAYIHMARPLFSQQKEAIVLRRLQRQLARLGRRNPNMLRGQNVFCAQIISTTHAQLRDGDTRGLAFWQARMGLAMQRWSTTVDRSERLRFYELAQVWRGEKQQEIDEEREHVAAAITLLKARLHQDSEGGPKNLLRANRFTDAAMKELATVVEAVPESRQAFDRFAEDIRKSVEPLTPDAVMELHAQPHWVYDQVRKGPPPPWLRIVARNRLEFHGTCFIRVDSETRAVDLSLVFLMAVQNPYRALFLQVDRHDALDAPEGLAAEPPASPYEHLFREQTMPWRCDLDLRISVEDEEWFILPNVSRIENGWLASDSDIVPWCVYIRDLHDAVDGGEAQGQRRPKRMREGVPQWAQRWIRGGDPVLEPAVAARAREPLLATVEEHLTKEQEEAVELELAEVRAWLAETLPNDCHHFSVRALGGKWTRRNRHLSWGALQGYARTAEAKAFCAQFNMQESMRFGASEFSRGEGMMMALAWARRMTHYYNIWEVEDFGAVAFSSKDAEAHDDLELVEAMLLAGADSAFYRRAMAVRNTFPSAYVEE